jgi:Mn2+/Fe2+ NRAMP family transporter
MPFYDRFQFVVVVVVVVVVVIVSIRRSAQHIPLSHYDMTEPAMRRPKSPSDGQHVFAYHNTRDTVYKRPPTNLSRPQRKKRRRPRWSTFTSVLYLSSFWFFILITIALLAAAAFGLGEQALRTGGQSAFNIFTIAGAYVLLVSQMTLGLADIVGFDIHHSCVE